MSFPSPEPIKRIVVLGAGSAGLLAVIALKRRLPHVSVHIIRSKDIGVIGVGEGTTDQFPRVVFGVLGLDPRKFYEEAKPQWKLGLKFLWGPRSQFYYTFSNALNYRQRGLPRDNGFYTDGSPTDLWTAMMEAGRVIPRAPTNPAQPMFFGEFGHQCLAFHIENVRLVAHLESCCRGLGVEFQDATVSGVEKGSQGVAALILESGEKVVGDLFVDASGFRSELLGRALEEPYQSYSNALFCDRAVIGGWDRTDEPILPYTTCETMDAGWCWQIEHEHFINRGYVYASSHISDEDARAELLRKNPKVSPEKPRVVKFRSGRYARHWVGNVFAVGNSSGFVEPLEATALAVILGQVCTLANSLEDCALQPTPTVREVANRYLGGVWDDVRDFLAVHYRFNTRLETKFWQHCRAETPLGRAEDIVEFYRENGPAGYGKTVLLGQNNPNNWEGFIAMLVGQDVPHHRPHSPTDAERMLWQKRVTECRRVASRAFAPSELCEVVRRPGWNWWPKWEPFS